jgi:Xaa-Pro aminopeptidase
MNPYFERQEYERRCERAQTLMRAKGIAALFITSEHNLYYLTGHRPFTPWHSTTRPTVLILPAVGQPILFAHAVWLGAAQRDAWVPDVRGYTELTGLPLNLLADALRQLNLSHAAIGAELGLEQRLGLPPADFDALREALPGVEWLDAAGLLWRLRLLKSPAEIGCLRRAGAANMAAFDAVYSRLAPGMTQEEVVHQLQAAICSAGADVGFVSATFDGPTYAALSCLPSDRPLHAGDLIFTDMGSVYHGYWSDFSRAASLGQPAAAHLRLWEAIHRVTMKGVETMRPGLPIADIVAACAAEADRQGIVLNFAAGRIGHSIGLMLTEPPSVTLHEHAILEPGMALTLEPGIVNTEGVFVVEQNVVITSDGVEILSAGPWEMWIA